MAAASAAHPHPLGHGTRPVARSLAYVTGLPGSGVPAAAALAAPASHSPPAPAAAAPASAGTAHAPSMPAAPGEPRRPGGDPACSLPITVTPMNVHHNR